TRFMNDEDFLSQRTVGFPTALRVRAFVRVEGGPPLPPGTHARPTASPIRVNPRRMDGRAVTGFAAQRVSGANVPLLRGMEHLPTRSPSASSRSSVQEPVATWSAPVTGRRGRYRPTPRNVVDHLTKSTQRRVSDHFADTVLGRSPERYRSGDVDKVDV